MTRAGLGALAVLIGLAAAAPKRAEPPAPARPAPSTAPARTTTGRATTERAPLGFRPYRIRVWLEVDPRVRLGAEGRGRLVAQWLGLIRRFVGPPWDVHLADEAGPLAGGDLEAVAPKDVAKAASGFDKGWMIRIEPAGAGYALSGREYDVRTGRLGLVRRRPAPFPADAPRTLFTLARDLFAPLAEVGESSAGGVTITVQAAALPAASPVGRVAEVGSVFRPLRIYQKPDGSVLQIRDIPWTYLRVAELEPPEARCQIVTTLRNPLTSKVGRRNTLVALGVKPTTAPIRIRFLTQPDGRPAAGYTLTIQPFPNGTPRPVGMTDREGRIVLEPGVAHGLSMIRLLAGDVEPLVEMPIMPGDVPEGRPIAIDPRSQTVALETQINSLRDEIVDQLLLRGRYTKLLDARVEGEKWDEVAKLLDEARRLPDPATFADRLAKLKDEAARRQAATKNAILTKNAQQRLAETQAMIDGYLKDEDFKPYEVALEEYRARRAKAAPRPGVTPRPGLAPRSATATAPPLARPATPPPAARPAPTPPSNTPGPAVPF